MPHKILLYEIRINLLWVHWISHFLQGTRETRPCLSGRIVRFASHCFPIEKVGRQDFTHMIARPSSNTDIKNKLRPTVPDELLEDGDGLGDDADLGVHLPRDQAQHRRPGPAAPFIIGGLQSYDNSFGGNVVLERFNMSYRDEENILD